jgi:hypothetical protein
VPLQYVERQIDAILGQIDNHVLPEIGELERGAGGIGKLLPRGVAITAQAQHQPAHGIRRVAAVVKHLFEIAIAGDGLILFKGFDQIVERLHRQLMPRGGIPQRHENGMLGPARIHGFELAAPPREQAQTFPRVADLVAQIVGPTAKGVDVIEILMQAPGKKKADDVKILVMVRRQPPRVGQRFFDGPRAR